MHRMDPRTADLIAAAATFNGYETPKTHRVSRCVDCDRAYAWKGSAPRPACPVCGGALTTTTRMLKRAAFIELAGELLTIAELKPNGLEGAARWEELHAANLDQRVADFRARAEAEPNRYRIEEDGTLAHYRQSEGRAWEGPAGEWVRSGSAGTVAGIAEAAAKARAKAATYRRRAARLARLAVATIV